MDMATSASSGGGSFGVYVTGHGTSSTGATPLVLVGTQITVGRGGNDQQNTTGGGGGSGGDGREKKFKIFLSDNGDYDTSDGGDGGKGASGQTGGGGGGGAGGVAYGVYLGLNVPTPNSKNVIFAGNGGGGTGGPQAGTVTTAVGGASGTSNK